MQKNPNLFLLVIGSPSGLLLPFFTCTQSLVKFWSRSKVETYKLYTTFSFFLNQRIEFMYSTFNQQC
jgi:hypothetical protein